MGNRSLPYIAIFLTVFIDILGFGIVIPVLPLYAEHFGATTWEIGWLVGIFSLSQFFFSPVWGKISDRVGRKPVLLIGMIGTVVGYLLMGMAKVVLVLFIARLIAGVASANIGTAQAYLADISSPETRARAMGLLGAAFGLGFVFGPALGGWAGVTFGYASPMFIAAGLAALNFFFVLGFLPESHTTRSEKRARIFPELWENVNVQTYLFSFFCYFLVIAGFSMMTTIFALFLKHRFDLDARHTGYILAAIGIVGVIIQGGLIGRLVKRFGEASLALVGTLIMGAGLVGLAMSRQFSTMLAASAAVGVGNSLLMPTLSALASRSASAEWQGRALGVVQSGGSLARWFGPVIAGVLLGLPHGSSMSSYGFLPLIVSGGFLGAAAVAAFLLLQRTPRPVRQNT
jgi:MFS transporter, DHA1 family, tetracycline resistance protein